MSFAYIEHASTVLAIIFLAISAFQFLLAIGKPYGDMAWGGQHKILPKNLRISSGVAVFVWLFVSLVFAEQAGIIGIGLGDHTFEVVLWILTPFMAVGTVMNGISRSRKERNLWTPVNAVSFLLCLYLLLSW